MSQQISDSYGPRRSLARPQARFQGRFIAVVAALLGTLAATQKAGAIGPETPVDFVAGYLDKGFLVMVIEPQLVTDISLLRVVHRDGEVLSRAELKWRELRMLEYTAPITGPDAFQYRDPREPKPQTQAAAPALSIESAKPNPRLQLAQAGAPLVLGDGPPKRVGVLIPIELERHGRLADGAYAEKYLARVRLAGAGEAVKPLEMLRWVHFVVRDRRARLLTPAEYSRLVDPPEAALDGAGAKIAVNVGRDVKAELPLERTKMSKAVPLGALGGVAPERESGRAERSTEESRER